MPSAHLQNQSHPLRHTSGIFPRARHFILAAALALVATTLQARPQSVATSPGPRLVDVMVSSKDPAAMQSLHAEDFQLFDGRTPLLISTFASASTGAARPISVWFVVQCPEERSTSSGSGFMLGKTDRLTPALRKLREKDTVGVAHWCDDGKSSVDLAPSTDRAASLTVAVAGISARDQMAGHTARDLEAEQTRSELSAASPGAIILMLDFAVPDQADRLRFIVRASGHLGSFEMPANQIRKPR